MSHKSKELSSDKNLFLGHKLIGLYGQIVMILTLFEQASESKGIFLKVLSQEE